jgi:hypothetical protein
MTSHQLPTAVPAGRLTHDVTRRHLEQLLAPGSSAGLHERQRALVEASLLTRGPASDPDDRRSGWVPG